MTEEKKTDITKKDIIGLSAKMFLCGLVTGVSFSYCGNLLTGQNYGENKRNIVTVNQQSIAPKTVNKVRKQTLFPKE